MKDPVTLQCAECEAEVIRPRARLKHMSDKAYCSKECMRVGRAKTRLTKGSYHSAVQREATRRAQRASQRRVDCPQGCGAQIVQSNLERHASVCLWPRTWERFAEIGNLGTSEPSGCLIWQGADASRYGTTANDRAHREAWRLSNDDLPIPDGFLIRHTCDRQGCVEPTHLLIGTAADNMRDARERGRQSGFQHWDPEDLRRMLKEKRWKR